MDVKYKKILLILSKDARTPISNIAKQVQLSRISVKKRIKKLVEQGIIKAFKTNIKYDTLGYKRYDFYFRFKDYNAEKEKRIIDYLVKNKYTTWVGTCFGAYDIRLTLIAKSDNQLNKIIEEMEESLSPYEYEYEACPVTKQYRMDGEAFTTNLLGLEPKKNSVRSTTKNEGVTGGKFDEKDKILLVELSKNPLVSLVELSNLLGIKPEAVKYRIKNLERKGVIKGYSAIINGLKLDKIWCILLVKLKGMTPKKEKELEAYLLGSVQATTSAKTLGKWNLTMGLFASNVKEIKELTLEFRELFSKNIQDYESLIVFDTHKYPRYIEGMFEDLTP